MDWLSGILICRTHVPDAWTGHCYACHRPDVQRRRTSGTHSLPPQQAPTRRRLGSVSADETWIDVADVRHTAAPPTAYGTVMNYVVLRLLGMGPDEGPMTEIRALIHKMGELV
jgi:hypothetical protein